MTRFIICTAPPGACAAIVQELLDRRLIGCCNIIPGLRSMYRWQGAVQDEAEELMLMETTKDACAEAMAALVELHPYEVPKVVSLAAESVHAAYQEWLDSVVGSPAS